MEIMKTIYPALATLIVAFLVFVYSFVNMLVSKDQKTMEFSQNWIDSIREEISQLLATFGYLATQAERLRPKDNGKNEFLTMYGDQIHEMGAI